MKTYVLIPTVKGGKRGNWSSNQWTNYYQISSRRIGRSSASGEPYATYFLFNTAELAALREKNVTSIKLSLTVVSGTIPSSSTETHQVGYKYNGAVGSDEAGSAWRRGNASSTAGSTDSIAFFRRASGGAKEADNTPLTISLGKVVPVYGYVIGPRDANVGGYVTVSSSATLTVTTDEAEEFTITYDANGGTGAPEAQTKPAGEAITLSNAEPTRLGYLFAGWNTAADGTGVSFAAGASYALDADATLYAQWNEITQTGVWVKGSDGQMHQGTVWVKGSDGQMHEATVYVKGSDGQMHQSS